MNVHHKFALSLLINRCSLQGCVGSPRPARYSLQGACSPMGARKVAPDETPDIVTFNRMRKEEQAYRATQAKATKAAAAKKNTLGTRFRAEGSKKFAAPGSELTHAYFEADLLASQVDDLVAGLTPDAEVAEVRRQYIAAVTEVRKLRAQKQTKKNPEATADFSNPTKNRLESMLKVSDQMNRLMLMRRESSTRQRYKVRRGAGGLPSGVFSRLSTWARKSVRSSSSKRDSWNRSSRHSASSRTSDHRVEAWGVP